MHKNVSAEELFRLVNPWSSSQFAVIRNAFMVTHLSPNFLHILSCPSSYIQFLSMNNGPGAPNLAKNCVDRPKRILVKRVIRQQEIMLQKPVHYRLLGLHRLAMVFTQGRHDIHPSINMYNSRNLKWYELYIYNIYYDHNCSRTKPKSTNTNCDKFPNVLSGTTDTGIKSQIELILRRFYINQGNLVRSFERINETLQKTTSWTC